MARRSPPLRPPPDHDLRDPATLARVFDATAPGLLRFAMHLVGDAATAEDLVQETFLAALESADRFDATRPVRPWLQGILAMRARRHVRARGRRPDPLRLPSRCAEAAPIDPDRSAALAAAIDELAPPYREVLLLRARHGLSPADIAHVLDRSPGAVRVQLHRGIQQLREALPKSPAVFALLATSPARGLEALKAKVIEHAAPPMGLSPLGGPIGGLLMGKLLIGSSALLLVLALALWQPWQRDGMNVRQGAPRDSGPKAEPPEVAGRLRAMRPPAAATPTSPPATGHLPVTLAGRVVDADVGNAGIEGATLRFFPTVEDTLAHLLRRSGDLIVRRPEGSLAFLGPTPVVLPPLTAAQQLGIDPVPVYTEPAPGHPALATARSGRDGTFHLEAPGRAGLLVVEMAGYGTRRIATRGAASNTTIALCPLRHVSLQLVDADGRPFPRSIRFVLGGDATVLPLGVSEDAPWEERTWAPNAARIVRSDAEGRVTARIAARLVTLTCRTPGYLLQGVTSSGRPQPGQAHVLASRSVPETPTRIRVAPVPTLHVVDANTGAPLPVVSIHGRDTGDGFLSFAGRRETVDGICTLFEDALTASRATGTNLTLHVWAEGYDPAVVRLSDLGTAGRIEVALVPGEAPALVVNARADGRPVAEAKVSLATYRAIAWNGRETSFVDAGRTDADGRIALHAPEGSYLLSIDDGTRRFLRVVAIPRDTGVEVDFERAPGIDVRVLDAEGRPRAGHPVGLSGGEGRSTSARTDPKGWARFDLLTEGAWRVFIPDVATGGSFGGDQLHALDLGHDGRAVVEFQLPSDRPLGARIRTDEAGADLGRWRVRRSEPTPGGPAWTALGIDGSVPPSVGAARRLEIETRDGRRYDVLVPEELDHDLDIVIPGPGSSPRYEGRITDMDGHPRRGVRVIGIPLSEDASKRRVWPSAVTNAAGRFTLVCAHDLVHRLCFSAQADGLTMHGTLDSFYRPKAATALDPTPLEIRLPRDEPVASFVQVHGVLRDEASGAPIPRILMVMSLRWEDEHGTLSFTPRKGFVHTDDEGRFSTNLPPAPSYGVQVSRDRKRPPHREVWVLESGARSISRDVLVPAGD